MVKVGVIGTGYMGKVHIEVLRRLPGIQVIAVADQNLQLARSVAPQNGIPQVYNDPEELFACEGIEVIHNCTPNHIHFEIKN